MGVRKKCNVFIEVFMCTVGNAMHVYKQICLAINYFFLNASFQSIVSIIKRMCEMEMCCDVTTSARDLELIVTLFKTKLNS